MDADEVLIEYLRSKLNAAKSGRAEKLMAAPKASPKVEDKMGESGALSAEDEQALMSALEGEESEEDESDKPKFR